MVRLRYFNNLSAVNVFYLARRGFRKHYALYLLDIFARYADVIRKVAFHRVRQRFALHAVIRLQRVYSRAERNKRFGIVLHNTRIVERRSVRIHRASVPCSRQFRESRQLKVFYKIGLVHAQKRIDKKSHSTRRIRTVFAMNDNGIIAFVCKYFKKLFDLRRFVCAVPERGFMPGFKQMFASCYIKNIGITTHVEFIISDIFA